MEQLKASAPATPPSPRRPLTSQFVPSSLSNTIATDLEGDVDQLRKLWSSSSAPCTQDRLPSIEPTANYDSDDDLTDIKALVRSFEEKVRDVFERPGSGSEDEESADGEASAGPEVTDSSFESFKSSAKKSSAEVRRLENELGQVRTELQNSREREQQLQQELATLKKLYENEVRTRRALNDELMTIKGNIRVFVRVRPHRAPADKEFFKLGKAVEVVDEATIAHVPQGRRYEFDAVLDETIDQQTVFDTHVAPLVMHVMDGTNCTLIAYGQTGSGKTHTMLGTKESPGMNRRALQRAFEIARNNPMERYVFTVAIFQVYNETIQDLLATSQNEESKNLDIRQHPETKQMFIKGLSKVEVRDANQVEALLSAAQKRRAVGGHAINERSSRSHLVLMLEVNARSNLVLIDLAGSERASRTEATGDRLRESQYINKSLSALGDVLQSLGDKQNRQHFPFRNSKLTYFLQDILSGNSKVAFFACVSPEIESQSETYCTLDFAERIRTVELLSSVRSPPPRGKLTTTKV